MTTSIKPPFSTASAQAKVVFIQAAWNSLSPEQVVPLYSLIPSGTAKVK